MTGFLATAAVAISFLLLAKLIIDYTGPEDTPGLKSDELRAEMKHLRDLAATMLREAERIERHASRELRKPLPSGRS